MRFQIALRNVLRNRRRTALNVLMIAGGLSAIVVFRGFAHSLIGRLEGVAINTQYGHVQVASAKTWTLSADDKPRDRLIDVTPELLARIEAQPEVRYASGRLSFFGLVSSGEQSVSARGLGFDPARETEMMAAMRVIDGRKFSPGAKFEVMLGVGLRSQLGLKVGDSVTLLSYTFDGSVNAIDSEVVGVFQSGLAEVDNSTFFMPLEMAQKLTDTSSVERLIVQLRPGADSAEMKARIAGFLDPASSLQTREWRDLAQFYLQVVDYFAKQNLIIHWIIMLLALLAIANTVGMSIAERTGEIGTVRAMGDTRRTVMLNFLLEGLILGGIGGLVGCGLGLAGSKVLTALELPITVPGASLPVRMGVDILPEAYASGLLIMCLMAVLATLFPAFRASRMGIVDSLKRNL